MDNMPIPQIDDADLFRDLVLKPETFTLTAIRKKMSPALEGIDDIVLIREMIKIRSQGEN